MLAEFVYGEIADTFDADAPEESQFDAVLSAMRWACTELEAVVRTLEERRGQLAKGRGRQATGVAGHREAPGGGDAGEGRQEEGKSQEGLSRHICPAASCAMDSWRPALSCY